MPVYCRINIVVVLSEKTTCCELVNLVEETLTPGKAVQYPRLVC